MRGLVILASIGMLISSCRKPETCATYAKSSEVKYSIQDTATGKEVIAFNK